MSLPRPIIEVERVSWRRGLSNVGLRAVPEETAIAFTYDHTTYATMMATPADIEDFAVGFSLSERVISSQGQIEALDIIEHQNGIELRMTLAASQGQSFGERRRYLAGPTGCGLCGIESLAEASPPLPKIAGNFRVRAQDLSYAVISLSSKQSFNQATHAVHAAGLWIPGNDFVAIREDVGRHNALDKLAGALARASLSSEQAVVVLTSRISVEMVQKAAIMGVPVIAAVSAPTALAVRTAENSGITLVAIARDDGFETFTCRDRIDMAVSADAD